jgi:hypothetical protein
VEPQTWVFKNLTKKQAFCFGTLLALLLKISGEPHCITSFFLKEKTGFQTKIN